jgi:excisionase family DNA binding protein
MREVASRVAEVLSGERPRPKALLNVAEAADYLGRTKAAVQAMIHHKELPVIRNGRRVHLATRDLDHWIEKHRF